MIALVGLAGLGAGACVDNNADAPMRILGNVAPADGCVVDGASTTFQDDGVIEPTSAFGYVFTPAVINDLQIIGEEAIGPKTIYITHARVDIAFYDPDFANLPVDPGLVEFQVPVAGAVEPDGGTSGFSFEIVPPELLAAIGEQLPAPSATNPLPRTVLDVTVQMVGTRSGGEVVSNTFRYPVEVCDGCVVVNRGACTALPDEFMASTGGACNVLQDGQLDCCTDSTGFVCPAVRPPST